MPPTSPRASYAYKAHAAARLRAGGWIAVPRDLLVALGTRAGVLVAHLISLGQLRADPDGWIMATPRFVEDGVGIPAEAQERILDRLVEDGIAEVTYRHRCRSRYIRVDVARIEQIVREGGCP